MIIGIGGVSRSGKSQLATKLKKYLAPNRVIIIDLDDHTKSTQEIPMIRDRVDWESPRSIDWPVVFKKINNLDYDHLIIEGIFAYAYPELLSHYDLKIFIKISKKTFLKRRRKESRWGPEPEWYIEHVWQSHLKSGTPETLDHTYYSVSGETVINVDRIVKLINPDQI